MIIDTDVLIWYMRGNENARSVIDKASRFSISVITYMELVQGMRNKRELNSLRKALHVWGADILYLSADISAKAMFYVEQHFLSHSLEIADALIGATAVSTGMPIITGNHKHYKVMKDVQVNKFKHQ